LTDYQYRLLTTIANRVNTRDGKTRPVSDAILANESCGKRESACRGRKDLKRLGYINWHKEPNPKVKGRERNIYWLTPVILESPVRVILESHDIHKESSRDIDIDASTCVDARKQRPKPFHQWKGPSDQDIAWAKARGCSDLRIRTVHELLKRWAEEKNVWLTDAKWSDTWRNSFINQDAHDILNHSMSGAMLAEMERMLKSNSLPQDQVDDLRRVCTAIVDNEDYVDDPVWQQANRLLGMELGSDDDPYAEPTATGEHDGKS
jgi:hypothetical protein